MLCRPIPSTDVEQWNDTLAREHDIDDYYRHSGWAIRWVEHRRLRIIRRMVRIQPGESLLEVGCGGGHVLAMFPVANLTGLDVSGVILAKARRNLAHLNARLVKGEITDIDLPDDAFDKAVCTEVLEHVIDPEEILRQLQRVVVRGGTIVVTFPNDGLINQIKSIIRRVKLTKLPAFRCIAWGADEYHLHVWSPAEMRDLLSRYFTVTRTSSAPLPIIPLRCCFTCVNDGK